MSELVKDNCQDDSPASNLVGSNEGITTNELENGTSSEENIKVVRFKQPTQRYTKEALLELQHLNSSKMRPKFLDNFPFLDLELASKTSRKGSRPVTASSKLPTNTKTVAIDLLPWQNQLIENGDPKIEKKPQDAKDRLKKDQDIVLSPQRRSFNSGCFVTMSAASGPKRSNSPLNTSAKQYVEREVVREPRRVGSGRLISRDSWESGYRQSENGIANNYNFGKGGFRESTSHNSIESRRKDFDFDRGESERYRNFDRFKGSGNFDKRRNDSYRTQEEPEWMTDGPTSQHDTIELRGFEDPPSDKSKKKKTKLAARVKKNSLDSTSTEQLTTVKGATESKTKKTKKEKEEDKKKKSTIEKPNNESEDQIKKDSESITGNEFIQAYDAEHKTNDNMFNDFNIDDFLKPDYISDIMHLEGETDANVAGSRFRQWFTTHDSSRASSASTEMLNSGINKGSTDNVEEDPRHFSSMLMDMVKHGQSESKNITNAYDSITSSENNKLPPAIMDVIIKAKAPQLTDPKAAIRDLEVNGKVQSLEEIESRLRMSSGQQNGYLSPHSNVQYHDEMKLKKMQNMKIPQNEHENSSNDRHSTTNSQNYSILQMLNNAQGSQNYMANQGQNSSGSFGPPNNYRNQLPSMQVPNDLVMKLMEAQQIQKQHENMVAKAMAAQQQSKQQMYKLPAELQNMVNFYLPTKEILQSREAQEMLMGIKRGEVMLHHLVEQWKKTSQNQSRYRETLICLMKVFQHNNAQRMVNQQDLVYQQQAALYQSQMLKRQLLDQNHKRMENVHNTSYGGDGPMDLSSSQSQSQPRIGLTPTSVLRKMTSTSEPLVDKHHISDERAATQHSLQHQINTLQQQIQQQQFMQQHQQQQRPVNTTIQQILSGNYQRYHGAQQPQHHHQQQQQQQQQNTMNGRSMNYGSGDKSRVNRVQSPVSNQLARWFSPELLAQARAGRLPNMPAMSQNINMLSVEDLEKFQVGGRS